MEMFNGEIVTNGITAGTELRKQRGAEIAKVARIDRKGDKFLVPSMSGNGRYTVDPIAQTCTCHDHQQRHCRCKHLFAVQFSVSREVTDNADGSQTVTETVEIKATKRTTYPQNWPAYNDAQVNEKREFQSLLADLCKSIKQPAQDMSKGGRPRLPIGDAVFSAVFKVYSTMSARRFTSDLCDAQAKGYIADVPHFNSVLKVLESAEVYDILTKLIVESSKPLAAVESDFAIDSTGFTACRFHRWYDHKYGAMKQEHDWVKAHLCCGVKTNIVTAVEIKDRNASDAKQLPALMETTAQTFTMSEVSCDKGYSDVATTNEIAKHGATPYVMYKKNANGRGSNGKSNKQDRGLWEKMFHYFSFRQDDFLAHYHKRSNIESTNSMIKAKFGDAVRSKTEVAMKNEALCKILCHNICCLISAVRELGVEIAL